MAATLVVALDARQINKDDRKQQKLKVAVRGTKGRAQSQTLALAGDSVQLKFSVEPRQTLEVAVGPADASDDELFQLQTLTQRVLPSQWRTQKLLTLPALALTPFYWRFWLRWCRNITVSGRVLCRDGRPVPGARVQAFDVDYVWWWASQQQAGPTVLTDANGNFSISFRWCCGWLPLWWWRMRHWQLQPQLAGRILQVLRLNEKLPPIPKPGPVPDLGLLQKMLAAPAGPLARPTGSPVLAQERATLPGFDPSALAGLRSGLLQQLPRLPELERLRLWPWAPWTPWTDCTPDLIFRVTQDCGDGEKLIVDETVFDTRWNIPNQLDVTLHANEQACCSLDIDEPEGDCLVFTKACSTLVTSIEQSPASALLGLAGPGVADQPFGGVVTLRGQLGTGANIDAYEILHTQTPAVPASWGPLNPAACGGFTRSYLDIGPGSSIVARHFAAVFAPESGATVAPSLEHFEAANPPPPGVVLRVPVGGQDVLVNLLSANLLADGVHHFAVRAWSRGPGGVLQNPRMLPLCGTQTPAGLALRLDNRFVDGSAPFDMPPPSPLQACGPGTVHTCSAEPDTRILAVRYQGQVVQPCDVLDTRAGGPVTIDFFAHDPDGILSHLALQSLHGENLAIDLLGLPGAVLAPLSPAGLPPAAIGGIPQADAAVPTYAQAMATPPLARPLWHGGLMRLTLPDVRQAFPSTCAYVLQVDAFKRTIADCNYNLPYRNRSQFSLTVTV